jgi:hypothetical protein
MRTYARLGLVFAVVALALPLWGVGPARAGSPSGRALFG